MDRSLRPGPFCNVPDSGLLKLGPRGLVPVRQDVCKKAKRSLETGSARIAAPLCVGLFGLIELLPVGCSLMSELLLSFPIVSHKGLVRLRFRCRESRLDELQSPTQTCQQRGRRISITLQVTDDNV
ncbi:hypothetical protein F2P81_008341 [Scophthalmus maximus]|uniref:Uncharacterized protein n=1 Tax=Scophthalmus maximus TaxID=52904 RepID=A0A6A4SXZ9_SCOMX|nr:hypothetical protein F2P81_008341 [Scophthalmus maximus]